MNLLNFFKPAPHIDEIPDPGEVKQKYRYWRWRTFVGMYIGYIFYYFTRKSLIIAMPVMIQDLGFTKVQLGILGSVLYMSYGMSKFVSGVAADRSNPRYFMGFGLILTGICNIFFGFSSSLMLFTVFWGLNGWFQGWGWPPCARLLTHWYSQNERGSWWGTWNTSHNIGGLAIAFVGAMVATHFGWRAAMLVPGILCVGVGIFLIACLRDTPQSLGLPPIEKFRNDETELAGADEKKDLSVKEILFEYVLKNRFIWILAIAYFFVYVVRTAVNDWTTVYLCEAKNYSILTAGSCVGMFEIGGIFGSLASGAMSDRIFKGRRGPVNVIFAAGVFGAFLLLWFFPGVHHMLHMGILFLMGFFVFGPQMLIGMHAAELSHKKAAGTATGFCGWFAYFGAAAACVPIGMIIDSYSWTGYLFVIGVCSISALLLLLPLWSATGKKSVAVEA